MEKTMNQPTDYLLKIVELWHRLSSEERKVIIEWHWDMYSLLATYLRRKRDYIKRLIKIRKRINPRWRQGVIHELENKMRLVQSLCREEYSSAIRSLSFTSDGRFAIKLGSIPSEQRANTRGNG